MADRAFYGVTPDGGAYNDGTVFSVALDGNQPTLAWFDGYNGANPDSPLVVGPDGRLYGTTRNGGQGGNGTVFRIMRR